MLAPAFTDEIEDALRRRGLSARRLVLISPPSARKRGRCVYRVELADGGTLKARRLESAAAAARLVALRAGIDLAFAPVVAREGGVLLEAWIAGELLSALDAGARAAEAGALLARLHSVPVASAPATLDLVALRERAAAELESLAAAGLLTADERARLTRLLDRHPPHAAVPVLVHRDFCAENMVVDPDGRLHVIDNEWLDVAPAALDLGRAFSRWPMSPAAWTRLLGAYRATAAADPGPLAFWKLATALTSACIRIGKAPARLEIPLALLRRAAATPADVLVDPR